MNDSLNAELLRAANGIKNTSRVRIRDLLCRAIGEIRDMRIEVGIPGSGTSRDAVIKLLDTAARAEAHSDEELQAAVIEAADMIRTLRVVAGSGIELSLRISDATDHDG